MYGIYIHVPFCIRKCPYCDFYSVAAQEDRMRGYLDALSSQICSFPPVSADTVYLGGGTPSLLPPEAVRQILDLLCSHHRIAEEAEISMECNPASVTVETLRGYREAGVNRLSVGCQSFQPALLARLGRLHTAEDAVRTVLDAREAGFDNISVDLMLGIPDATPETTLRDAETAASLPVDHISAYILKICEGTPFADGVEGIPDDDTQAECYLTFCGYLEQQGFRQYEISNFTRGGKACRHNLKYWNCGQWLGFGPGAHMSNGEDRYSYPRSLSRFLNDYGMPVSGDPLRFFSHEGTVDAEEAVILGLRTDKGISLKEICGRFGWSPDERQRRFLDQCEKAGYVSQTEDRLCLTRAGFLVSNSILSELCP